MKIPPPPPRNASKCKLDFLIPPHCKFRFKICTESVPDAPHNSRHAARGLNAPLRSAQCAVRSAQVYRGHDATTNQIRGR